LGEGVTGNEGTGSTPASVTSPEALNEFLARSDEELAVFADMDERLFQARPEYANMSSVRRRRRTTVLAQQKAQADHPVADEELPLEERLMLCGRLMRPEDAPKGFAISEDA